MIDAEDIVERTLQGPVPDVWIFRRSVAWDDSVSPKRAGITTGLIVCFVPDIILYILLISSIRWYFIGYSGYRMIIIITVLLIIVIPIISGFVESKILASARNTVLLITNGEIIRCMNYTDTVKRSIKVYQYKKLASAGFKVSTSKNFKTRALVNRIEITIQYNQQKWPEVWKFDLRDQTFETVLQEFSLFYAAYFTINHTS